MKIEIDVPGIPDPFVTAGGRPDRAGYLRALLNRVCLAHYQSAKENNCVSSAAVRNCNAGNPGTLNGIASAILSLGEIHAPVKRAREIWLNKPNMLSTCLRLDCKVAGFGNSFFPNGDPKWFPVRQHLKDHFPEAYGQLLAKEAIMLAKSPTLYANAAMYTAITCELLQVPVGHEALLFILPRLPAWFEL